MGNGERGVDEKAKRLQGSMCVKVLLNVRPKPRSSLERSDVYWVSLQCLLRRHIAVCDAECKMLQFMRREAAGA
jgi:hypothetical protein